LTKSEKRKTNTYARPKGEWAQEMLGDEGTDHEVVRG